MYIPNNDTQITPSVDYKMWMKHLDTQFNEPNKSKFITNSQQIRNRYYKLPNVPLLSGFAYMDI